MVSFNDRFAGCYDSFTASMEKAVPNFVGDLAFSFNAPRVLKIHDPFLGLIEKVLKILVIIYAGMTMFSARTYLYTEAPNGAPILFFERLSFNKERNVDWTPSSKLSYCAEPHKYAHYVQKQDAIGKTVSPVKNTTSLEWEIGKDAQGKPLVNYWNDDKPSCKQLNFAEIVKKTEHTAYITTWQKETLSTVRKCGDVDGTNANAQTCESVGVRESSDTESTILKKFDGSPFYKIKEAQTADGDTNSCTCLELRNYIPVAPEHVGLRFYHTYTTSTEAGSVTGSTTLHGKSEGGSGLNPTTVIRRKKAGTASGSTLDGNTLPQRTILPGEPIIMSVNELITLAGVPGGLDGEVGREFADLAPGQPAPKRRTNGVTINMDLLYDVDVDKGTAVCNLEVSYTDGEVSWSPNVQMHQRQLFNAFTGANPNGTHANVDVVRQYSELYNRGVKIQFSARGKVTKFEYFYFMSALIQLFVLLPLTTTIVGFLATSVLPRRDLYNPAISETLDYDRELSKFAASSALAAAQFQAWSLIVKSKQLGKADGSTATVEDLKTPEDLELTQEELAGLLQPTLSSEQAVLLAGQIFTHGDCDGDGTISVHEMVDIVSTDIVNFTKLQKHMKRKEAEKERRLEKAREQDNAGSPNKISKETMKPQLQFSDLEAAFDDEKGIQNPASP